MKEITLKDLLSMQTGIRSRDWALYQWEGNFAYDNFQLIFDSALDYAQFSYTAKESDVASFEVGLDGAYRFSDTEIGPFAAYGSWTGPNTFEITYWQIGYSTGAKFVLTFDGDAITVEEFGVVGSCTYSGVMQYFEISE